MIKCGFILIHFNASFVLRIHSFLTYYLDPELDAELGPGPHSFSKLDPDPHSLKKLDPDPQKVDADLKH
jgi:hypothetical protein